jgi:hypothetical protein
MVAHPMRVIIFGILGIGFNFQGVIVNGDKLMRQA